ncbi:hypothetical protein MtrunA17_Chr4g0031581 [Medicago truncatula]|uniref:Uncharacterized protein n=1 Tax=Medicago truncatula TaxID=3880 RepID=A0A396I890_MEDTR|nr:hypothetical protein MtrunA17_Chr4g0031581 [Medicago truncatula]
MGNIISTSSTRTILIAAIYILNLQLLQIRNNLIHVWSQLGFY